MGSFWSRRSTVVFFLVAFVPAWIGWSIYQALRLDRSTALGEGLYLSAWFCTFAGFVAWYVEAGRKGVGDLARRCVRWRVSVLWWLIVLAFPIVYQIAAFALHGALAGGVGTVRPAAIAQYWSQGGLALLLTGPLGEEGGWRGFLLPRMLERWSPLRASVTIGLIWAVWHVPIFLRNEFSTLHGTLVFTCTIVCYSVVMTVVAMHSRHSVLLAILMHWTFNVSYYRAAPRMFPDVDVRGLAFNYTRLGVFVLAAALLVVAAGLRSFLARPAAVPASGLAAGPRLESA
jgi:membrane protease YdiL (CAAX protease family)